MNRRGTWPFIVISTLVLLAPAIWNRFPFVFADTGGYLARAYEHTLELGRSAFYGVFIASTARLAFWPAVVGQAVLTAWVLLVTLRVQDVRGTWRRLGIVAVLA